MKKFNLKADIIFLAANIDDAMKKLSNHFKDPFESTLGQIGDIQISKIEEEV